jgi:hypothetical protein
MKYSQTCAWGELFGLDIKSLSDEHLNNISPAKLIEFIKIDPRVEKIVGDKIINDTKAMPALTAISSFEEEIATCQYFVSKYNELYAKISGDISKKLKSDYYYNRGNYIYWGLLNEENRKIEFSIFSKSEDSIINVSNIDYDWLYKNDAALADSIIDRVMRDYPHPSSAIIHLIKNIPVHKLDSFLPKLFKEDKQVYMYALENPNLPEEYTSRALRVTTKRTKIPNINAKITETVLKKLPTVTRLEVLESILRCGHYQYRLSHVARGLKFEGITEEVLRNLLFGNVIRHNSRVENVIKRFKELN